MSPDAELEFERDARGRVTAEICNGRTVFSAYDAAGQLMRRITPSGAETHWAYDVAGRPAALEAGGNELRFGYDQAGRKQPASYPVRQSWPRRGTPPGG